MPHLRSARSARARPMSPPPSPAPRSTTSTALRALRRRGRRRDLRVRECRRSSRSRCSATSCGPAPRSLAVAQDRAEEKALHRSAAARGSRRGARSPASPRSRPRSPTLGTPLVLKSRRYGYDGKGQAWVRAPAGRGRPPGTRSAEQPAVAEAGDRLRRRIFGHRRALGRWPTPRSGIARATSIATASCAARPCPPATGDRAAGRRRRATAAIAIAEALGHVGVLTVEFFATADGPLVNEIAPRVHNSGHWTIEGAETSQFEQHIRAICGLPPGSTALTGSRRDDGQSDRRRGRALARAGRRARRAPPPLRQGRSAPRPQDGPRDAGHRR